MASYELVSLVVLEFSRIAIRKLQFFCVKS
jgi:hypothetical protein